ncbi:amidohydrolase family protein [Xanthomonas fragariae]
MARRSADQHRVRAACALHRERCQLRTCAHAGRPARHPGAFAHARDSAGSGRFGQAIRAAPTGATGSAGSGQRPPDRGAHDPAYRCGNPSVRRARRQRGALPRIQPQAGVRFCPACALQRAGVNLAIGTDGCASNNDLDMFSENRTAAILAKAVANDATALDAATTLRAATLGGARALGFGDKIGSIEIGKQADLVCVDLSALETQPLHHVLSQLIYSAGRHQVTDVWIAGNPKLVQRGLVDMDTAALVANARQWRERIRTVRA